MTDTRLLSILALMATAGAVEAQGTLRPAPSTRATAEVALSAPNPGGGMSPATATIRIDYGQPHLRGRALNTDSLVPFDQPWRLGANANTVLTTGVDLQFGNVTLPRGEYVLYAVPARSGWTLVAQRDVGQTAAGYPDSATVARVPLRHTALANPVESLSMWLIPSTEAGVAKGELRFAWGVHQLSANWVAR